MAWWDDFINFFMEPGKHAQTPTHIGAFNPGGPSLGLNGGGPNLNLKQGSNGGGLQAGNAERRPAPAAATSRSVDDQRDAAMARRGGMQPVTEQDRAAAQPQGPDLRQQFLDAMNQKFNFDRNGVDTKFIDDLLNQRMALIQKAKDEAQGHFNQSDADMAAMYAANQRGVMAQAPTIDAQYDKTGADMGKVFDASRQRSQEDEANYRAQQTQMLRDLGIAPAANAPDLAGQSFVEGRNRIDAGRDAALKENESLNQVALDRNTQAAQAVANDGAMRRAELTKTLQEIFGNLDQKGVEFQGDAANTRNDYITQQEGRAYDQWRDARNFNADMFNQYNGMLQDALKTQGKSGAKSDTVDGILGLDSLYDPAIKNEFRAIMESSPKADPHDVANFYRMFMDRRNKGVNNLDQDAFWQYLTAYNQLGNTSKFPTS